MFDERIGAGRSPSPSSTGPAPNVPFPLSSSDPLDLVVRITELRRTLRALPPEGEQARALREELRPLYRALASRRRTTEKPRARNPLDAARELADVLRFEVPPSHRKAVGSVVRATKLAFIRGLEPFHIEALRPQAKFNAELVRALEDILSSTSRGPGAGAWLHGALVPFADPLQFSVPSHRRGISGALAASVKRAYLRGLEPVLRKVFARQAAWNRRAIELAEIAAEGRIPPVEEANQLIASLAQLCDPIGDARAPIVKVLSPLWRELLRRQGRFDTEIMLVLSNLLNGRPPVVAPPPSDYRSWYEAREPQEIASARARLNALRDRPLISVVVPAWETPPEILRECVESVRAQLYDHWELCIVDDGSRSKRVRAVLEQYARKDPRIRWSRLERNGGIARATNAAIEMARGELIAFLDHDDVLTPHALAEVALRFAEEPSLDWVYSDEDRITNAGTRQTPFFKPDFSIELLRSVNYICHFVVARSALVKELKLRDGFQGSQDYDFLLRLSERTKRVGHIPKVLYHWRTSPISLSQDHSKLKAASIAGMRALREHLERCGESGEVSDPWPTHYRVRYPVRGRPLVSIIVPFRDRPELLERLVRTLLGRTTWDHFELLLVSNQSRDPATFTLLEGFSDPRIRKLEWNHPFNYPAINNYAATQARGDLLLFLNNDIEITDPRWLEELIGHAQRPDVAMVGPKLLFPDGSIQHAGVVIGICGYAAHPFWRFPDTQHWTSFGHADWNRDYLAVTSACVMMRREIFDALHGFDERFRVCGSDVDLGLRAVRMGKRVVYTAGTWLYHHESASRRNDAIPEDDYWESVVAYRDVLERGDPFYNPNLSLTSTECDLKRGSQTALELAIDVLAEFAAAHQIEPT